MSRVLVLTALVAALFAVLAAPASAQERHSCGNYGYPEGSRGDKPIFTDEPIVGAGVEDIRTRGIGLRRPIRRCRCPHARRWLGERSAATADGSRYDDRRRW